MDNFPTSQYHFSEVKNPGLKKNTTEEGSRWNQDDTHIHTLAPGAAHGDRTLLLRQGLISRGWAVVVGGPGPSVLGEPSRGGGDLGTIEQEVHEKHEVRHPFELI